MDDGQAARERHQNLTIDKLISCFYAPYQLSKYLLQFVELNSTIPNHTNYWSTCYNSSVWAAAYGCELAEQGDNPMYTWNRPAEDLLRRNQRALKLQQSERTQAGAILHSLRRNWLLSNKDRRGLPSAIDPAPLICLWSPLMPPGKSFLLFLLLANIKRIRFHLKHSKAKHSLCEKTINFV